jgi:tetrapyrrole methylase family protein/MazG family protein
MNQDKKIIIVGMDCQDIKAIKLVKSCKVVYARGSSASQWLADIYEQDVIQVGGEGIVLDDLAFENWLVQIQAAVESDKKVAYVTSVSPAMVDHLVLCLVRQFGIAQIESFQGTFSLLENLPLQVSTGLEQLITLDGLTLRGLYHPPFSTAQTVAILYPTSSLTLLDLQRLCSLQYPNSHSLLALTSESGNKIWKTVQLKDLGQITTYVDALLIPALERGRSLEAFQEVIARLRAPDGCPWDKKQTHASLRTYLLEETYEALDALDRGDLSGLQEELGDLLLQIVLHTRIAEENHEFQMGDVLAGIHKKIIFRHPHVFKDWHVDGESQVVQNWETLKQQERDDNGEEISKGLLEGVPASFPALAQAQAIQDRAARVGFDWQEIQPVLDKVREEIDEIEKAQTDIDVASEFGDLLFALVNLIRWKKIDAESVLRQTNLKFRKRFSYIETAARQTGKKLNGMTLDEMDVLWEQSKEFDD